MANLKDFNKGWKKLQTLAEIVQTLGKIRGDPSAFASYHSDFLGFIRDDCKVHNPQIAQLNIGDSGQKASSAQTLAYEIQKDSTISARNDIADISTDLGADLEGIALTIVPLKDIDLDKASRLNSVVREYTAKAIGKRNELATIDRTNDPDAYEAVEDLAKEYEGFARIITSHKPLVKEIAEYRELVSHLSSNRGKPDNAKLKGLYDEHLDKLGRSRALNKYDRMVLKVAKSLSNNEHYLPTYYIEGLVKPSENKIKQTVINNNYNLKQYLDQTVGAMNLNSAGAFFNGLHARTTA